MKARQADLSGDAPATPVFQPMEDFVAGIRKGLLATLAKATAAQEMPWESLTQMMVTELTFDSLTKWLPPAEAMRADFHVQIVRSYAILDEGVPDIPDEWDDPA